MKSRITKKFEKIKVIGKKALIPYITCGDPDLNTTYNLVFELEKAGTDIIELGIPYSDPLADGPVIQRAAQRALNGGINIDDIFNTVSKIREKTEIPLVFLIYFNSMLRYGIKKFLNKCKNHGIDGLIIPDLPLEERIELNKLIEEYPIDLIFMVAPTSKDRIKEIVTDAEGFIYCVSSKGVTGTRNLVKEDLSGFISNIRKYTNIPLAIGFGISDKETVKELKDLCDGLIVGSAIIKKIEQGIEDSTIEKRVYNFVNSLHEAIDC